MHDIFLYTKRCICNCKTCVLQGTLTSSSSGHSSDDKWYEMHQELESSTQQAPPIPSKLIHHTGRSNNNTFPSLPKRNNNNNSHQTPSQQQIGHNHYTMQQIHHNKIQISNSLPLQHVNYSQPLSTTNDLDLCYKMEKNNIVKQQNEQRIRQENDYIVRQPKVADYSTVHLNNDYSRLNVNDSLSTDSSISDRINLVGSEDELSNGSGASPRSRRAKHFPVSGGNYSSRNQSPRSLNGEAKLRPGVTARSSNRNSANLSSNFQEELIRLISPENIDASSDTKVSKDIKSHSRENLNTSLSVHKSPEVIYTMARPATVISNASTTSSPLPNNEFKYSKEDLMKGCKSVKAIEFDEKFPFPDESDWPSLVESANRLMAQGGVSSDASGSNECERGHRLWDEETAMDASITSS